MGTKTEEEDKEAKKKKGKKRATGRRLKGWPAVIEWMARVRVASVEAVALGLDLTPRQVHEHAAYLKREGCLERPRLGDGQGGLLVVTPRGVRVAGGVVRSHSTPSSLSAYQHGRGVSWIAAYCELRGREWFGPLELQDRGFKLKLGRHGKEEAKSHLPDLAYVNDGDRWAVEYERVSKAGSRLKRIMAGYRSAQLAGELHAVLYVCGDENLRKLIDDAAEAAQIDRIVTTLELVIREARG